MIATNCLLLMNETRPSRYSCLDTLSEQTKNTHCTILQDRAIEGERRTATATLLVRVTDAEDEPPIFTRVPSVTRVAENAPIGSEVLKVAAVDGDRGVNNAISYRITRGGDGLFGIDQSSGAITVTGKLDREAAIQETTGSAAYILELEATEMTTTIVPAPSVKTEVTIILTDVNDETPTFKSPYYVAEVAENAPRDTQVKFVGAGNIAQVYDHDFGVNGTFTLSLDGDGAKFFDVQPTEVINEATFVIKVKESKALDYEKVKSYQFRIVAREKRPGNVATAAQVTVHIRDENDNSPRFEHQLYRTAVAENVAKGTLLAKFKATDADTGTFGTAGVRYTEVRGEVASKLSLDPITGDLTVATTDGFDREQSPQYALTVEARDNNGTGNRATVQLLVNVVDVNDNAPIFKPFKSSFLISESSEPGIVDTVEARDPDTGPSGEVVYRLQEVDNDPDTMNTFSIETVEGRGVIRLTSRLDYERKSMYQLRVLAIVSRR